MPQITVVSPFTLNWAGKSQAFSPGVYEIPQEALDAHGEFIRAFCDDAPEPAFVPGSHQFAQRQRELNIKAQEARQQGLEALEKHRQKQRQEAAERSAKAQAEFAEARRAALDPKSNKADPKAIADALLNAKPEVIGQSPRPDHPAIQDGYVGNQTAAEAAVGGPNTGSGEAKTQLNRDPKSPDALRTKDPQEVQQSQKKD
jgi:hypothetical protein